MKTKLTIAVLVSLIFLLGFNNCKYVRNMKLLKATIEKSLEEMYFEIVEIDENNCRVKITNPEYDKNLYPASFAGGD